MRKNTLAPASLSLALVALGVLGGCGIENKVGAGGTDTGSLPVEACEPTAERCDGLDNDCDGAVDEDPTDPQRGYEDADGDGVGGVEVVACTLPDGTVDAGGDCDDAAPAVFPGAPEICDELDNDCDDAVDEADPDLVDGLVRYVDADLDGHGDPDSAFVSCDPAAGVTTADDCDDAEDFVYPGATEICDEIDEDCDGVLDPEDCECGGPADTGLVVAITNSQAEAAGYTMNLEWETVATGLGHSVRSVLLGDLASSSTLAGVDLLVVTVGVSTFPAGVEAGIAAFIDAGGSVYLQSEYHCPYSTNQAFANIVNGRGASFAWTGTISGDLYAGVSASGCIADYPSAFPGFDYYWYGCGGVGIPGFLRYGGSDIAFQFCPTDRSKGQIITTTDQDWVLRAGAEDHLLMANMLNALATHPLSCP